MQLYIKNPETDQEDLLVEFNMDGEIESCYCHVSILDQWLNLTAKVLENEWLVNYIYEAYDHDTNLMLSDMSERNENK